MPLRILVPTIGFGRSGGNRVLSRLASEWGALGHDVAFVAHECGPAPYFPTRAAIRWIDDRGREVRQPANAPLARLAGGRGVWRNARALHRALRRIGAEADVVLANHSVTAWPVAFGAPPHTRWYYVQAYEPELFEGRAVSQRVLATLAALSYRLPLRRIVNAPLYRRFRRLTAEHVVPPGLDLTLFRPREPGATTGPLRIGVIGRAEAWKGTRQAVAAYRLLRDRGVNAELHVAYGNLTPDEAATPGVVVTVPADDGELAAFYRGLDVMLAAGLIQLGAPHYPVMEAMACGVPVVTTGYMPASPSNAWIVPPGDAPGIAAAVQELLGDPEEAQRRAARALDDVQPFAWPRVAAAMLAIFRGGA